MSPAPVVIAALLVLVAPAPGPGERLAGPRPAIAQPASDPPVASTGGRTLTGLDVKVNPDGYTSARTCGRCHVDIYDSWKNSLHAFSLTDPIFDTAYMQAFKEVGDEAKRLCLRCHAPMTLVNGDFDLEEGVTREGVSCDFCHTVTAVHLDDREKPYTVDLGLVKRGIIKRAGSPAHEVAYSPLHGTSEFCGGCHNYTAENGVAIMSTYDEWRRGPYADEGVQCQNCHMELSEGSVVTAEVKKTGPEIHLHNLIHDTDQLRSALAVQIVQATRTEGELEVEVKIANVGSGHNVPTGIPSREIVLTVTARFGDRVVDQDRHYRKVMADARGRILNTDWETLLYATQIVSDNRIAPREERVERFTFRIPRTGPVKITATASYVYVPLVLDQRRLEIKLTESERFVN